MPPTKKLEENTKLKGLYGVAAITVAIAVPFTLVGWHACTLQGLQDQVQGLEKHKADRWQLEASLAEKADRGLVSAKVSHTEFTAACINIHNDLGLAKSKLSEAVGSVGPDGPTTLINSDHRRFNPATVRARR